MIVASAVSHWRVEGDDGRGRQRRDVVGASEKVEQTWQMDEREALQKVVKMGCKKEREEGRKQRPTHFFTITKNCPRAISC